MNIKRQQLAELLGSISDVNVQEADRLLQMLIDNFDLEDDDLLETIDKLNLVDNEFPISIEDLMDSIGKASDATESHNVPYEKILGHTVAINQSTKEAGQIIGNALKSVYSRVFMDKNIELLKEVGIKNIDTVNDVIDELANKWDSFSLELKKKISVSLAGHYQLSRFMVLMENYGQVNGVSNLLDNKQ